MPSWRVAKSLLVLRDQINALSPNRSKVADGTVGDAAHASRSSDHNPWLKDGKTGVVTALDITDDEAHGIDSRAVGEAIRLSRDPRVKYIIADGQIAKAKAVTKGGKKYAAWAWSPYTGKNSHHHHVHISVQPSKALYDDTQPFDLSKLKVAPGKAAKPIVREKNPLLVKGNKGADVERLQRLLNAAGAKPKVNEDADFGDRTEKAVKSFQRAKRLVQDGKVGLNTWTALGA